MLILVNAISSASLEASPFPADNDRRAAALEAALAADAPSAESEEWRYSPIGDLDLSSYSAVLVAPEGIEPPTIVDSGADDVVAKVTIVDGWVTSIAHGPKWPAKGLTVEIADGRLTAGAEHREAGQLDLLHEAKATEELDEALTDIGVIVPKVFWKYTTRRVLTLEFIDGVKIDNLAQLDEWNVDRKALIQTYLQAFFRQAFEGGFFHCDPHPANVFCTREGQLALLDFGMVKRLPDAVRLGIVKEALGGFFNNPKLYADGLIERGVVDEVERDQLEGFAREMFDDASVRSAIFDHDFEDQGQVTQLFGKIDGLVKSLETFRTPHDQLMFMRALAIVIDVCKEVYPEESVSELTNPIIMPIFMTFVQENPQYAQNEG